MFKQAEEHVQALRARRAVLMSCGPLKFQVTQCKISTWIWMCSNYHLLSFSCWLIQQHLHFVHCMACVKYHLS